jgi:hypothetical protein
VSHCGTIGPTYLCSSSTWHVAEDHYEMPRSGAEVGGSKQKVGLEACVQEGHS